MKIIISLENIKTEVEFDSDADALLSYQKIICEILNKPSESKIIEGEDSALDKLEPEAASIKTKRKNPFRYKSQFSHEKMIAYKCPNCGKITVRKMALSKNNIAHCHFCRTKGIAVESVSIGVYECKDCNDSGYVWLANGITEAPCRICKTDLPCKITPTINVEMHATNTGK